MSIQIEMVTKKKSWFMSLFICAVMSSCSNEIVETTVGEDQHALINSTDESPYSNFKLFYSYAGLGSNMGQLAPSFALEGTHFMYSLEQNSYVGEQNLEPEKICEGEIPESTIDSIIELVENIEDSVIYETNVDVMSGGIHHIYIEYREEDLLFKLHNASHPIADRIVESLNAHIPSEHRRLFLWKER